MKCSNCGSEIKNTSKFCPSCGEKITSKVPTNNLDNSGAGNTNNKNALIISITAIIIVLIVATTAIYYFVPDTFGVSQENSFSSNQADSIVDSSDDSAKEIQNSSQNSGSWKSIGSFSGSGTGSKTISVPEGQIRIDLSAYPIKNYATNHLYVSGSNGEGASLDWGPKSAVATHSDSISFTSSSKTTFTIDYYETVSWNVEVYKYE